MTTGSSAFKVLKGVFGLVALGAVVGLIVAYAYGGGGWVLLGAALMLAWIGAGTLASDMGKVEEHPWRAYSWYAVVLDGEEVLGPEYSPGFRIAALLSSKEAAEMLVAAAPPSQRERLEIVRVFVK